MFTSAISNSGTTNCPSDSTRNDPFPSLEMPGSNFTPVVALTPSRLSKGKCFSSTGDPPSCRAGLVHASRPRQSSSTSEFFLMLPPCPVSRRGSLKHRSRSKGSSQTNEYLTDSEQRRDCENQTCCQSDIAPAEFGSRSLVPPEAESRGVPEGLPFDAHT